MQRQCSNWNYQTYGNFQRYITELHMLKVRDTSPEGKPARLQYADRVKNVFWTASRKALVWLIDRLIFRNTFNH